MNEIRFRGVTIALLLFGIALAAPGWTAGPAESALDGASRVMVIVPHPDDEVLGCAGVIQQTLARGLPLQIVFLTYGDANEWSFIARNKMPTLTSNRAISMGEVRHGEALAAGRAMGVSKDDIVFLGYPDYVTQRMLRAGWRDQPPVQGRMTKASKVPYASALNPGAPYKPESVVADLVTLIGEFNPTDIFVSHPADHHPDHAALYVYTRLALWELEGKVSPRVHAFLVHYPLWPGVTGFDPARDFGPPAALATATAWTRLTLDDSQIATKRRALEEHKTQYGYSAKRLLPFVRETELFAENATYSIGGREKELVLSDDEAGQSEVFVPDETPSDVTGEVRDEFVDIDAVRLTLSDATLSLRIALDRPVPARAQVAFYLFGDKAGIEFAQMPKLEIRLSSTSAFVYENGKKYRKERVRVVRQAREVSIQVPLSALGDPDRLIVGGRAWAAEIDSDHFPWQVVSLH